MEIQRWITVNIFFNDNEEAEADKIANRYIRRGYDSNGKDDGSDEHRICHQLVGSVQRNVLRRVNNGY